MKLLPVIMAGGTGSRLWPLSRAGHPKQFLALNADKTMLQETVLRLAGLSAEPPLTICNEDHRFFVADGLQEIDQLGSIILEPGSRNTAPAVALAALIHQKDDPLLLVMPADHVIKDQEAFTSAVENAIPLAEQGKLVTFGVVPTEPHTGYGYIETGDEIRGGFSVLSFREKPDSKTASSYVNSGRYYWNSGVFLFRASRYLEELKSFHPKIFVACSRAVSCIQIDLDFIRVDPSAFEQCPDESIDYAVMEKTSSAVVVPMDAGWNDIGSWSSLWEIADKDVNGNASLGDSLIHDTRNTFIRSDGKLVVTIGVDDLVIVSTKDAVMVAHRDRVHDVKLIVQELRSQNRSEWQWHREVFRPWGKYDSIDCGLRYQVKRITVNPGAKLSVQIHNYRAEHWVVVSGIAKVTNGDSTFMLSENESTYIPIGAIHSLENAGVDLLEIIEIQSGSYLGEDDIVRLSDIYGRVDELPQSSSTEVVQSFLKNTDQ